MKNIYQAIANAVNALGFTKNGSPMVVDQGEVVASKIAGCRNVHVLQNKLKSARLENLALVPDHPEECDGTDFIMADDATGVWVSVDGFSVHIVRGSEPQANDGGLRIFVYPKGSEDDVISSIQCYPEDGEIDEEVVDSSTEHCDRCNNPLAESQIGLCDDCQSDSDEEGKDVINHYFCPCGEIWEDTWSCECNDRCSSCNKEVEPFISDDGSMDQNEYERKLIALKQERCELFGSESWEHIFDGGTRIVRFVMTTSDHRMLAMQYKDGLSWVNASASMMADVRDSVVNANPECFDDPDSYSADYLMEMPAWVSSKD